MINSFVGWTVLSLRKFIPEILRRKFCVQIYYYYWILWFERSKCVNQIDASRTHDVVVDDDDNDGDADDEPMCTRHSALTHQPTFVGVRKFSICSHSTKRQCRRCRWHRPATPSPPMAPDAVAAAAVVIDRSNTNCVSWFIHHYSWILWNLISWIVVDDSYLIYGASHKHTHIPKPIHHFHSMKRWDHSFHFIFLRMPLVGKRERKKECLTQSKQTFQGQEDSIDAVWHVNTRVKRTGYFPVESLHRKSNKHLLVHPKHLNLCLFAICVRNSKQLLTYAWTVYTVKTIRNGLIHISKLHCWIDDNVP